MKTRRKRIWVVVSQQSKEHAWVFDGVHNSKSEANDQVKLLVEMVPNWLAKVVPAWAEFEV